MRTRTLVLCLVLSLNFPGAGPSHAADVPGAIPWFDSPGRALEAARQSGRPVLVYIASPHCGFCRKMERETWSDPTVAKLVTTAFVPLKVDGARHPEWMERFGLHGVPAVVVLSRSGASLLQLEGYQSPRTLVRRLNTVLRPPSERPAR